MEGYLVPLGYPTQDSLDTTTTRVRSKEVLLPKVKTSLPSPLVHENPEGFWQEQPRTERAESSAYDLWSHTHGRHPGWV